jgi:hypothetical protein
MTGVTRITLEAKMREVRLTVLLEPVSVNHYRSMRVVHWGAGKPMIRTYRTKAADALMAALAVLARGNFRPTWARR